MQIDILDDGNIEETLARKPIAAGHDVKVATSRGPTVAILHLACGSYKPERRPLNCRPT